MPDGELPLVEVSPSSLADLTDRDVLRLHARFAEGWQAHEAGQALPEGLNREEFVNRFAFVVAELEKRKLDRPDAGSLDVALARLTPKREADRLLPHALDRAACDKLLVALPNEIVLIRDYARLTGSFLSDEDGEEVDILLRDKARDPSRDLKLSRIVQSATNRVPGFQLAPDGFAESSGLPGYDLVLRKVDGLDMHVVREPEFQARIYGSMREVPERLTERRSAIRDSLVDFVCVPQFVSISGSFVYHDPNREPDDIDVVVKSGEARSDLIESIGELVREATEIDPHFVWEPRGPNWTYWPAYDLVCRVSSDRPEGQGLSEAFHLRDTHWVPVPESGSCPMSHPVKARFPGKQKLVCFRRTAAEAAAQARMREADLNEGIRPAFGAAGGKRALAPLIVGRLPKHKVYVEAFVGGGAVFFGKEPAEVEVIGDLDANVIRSYRIMKSLKDSDIARIREKDWIDSRRTWESMSRTNPQTDLAWLHKFLYLRRFTIPQHGASLFREDQQGKSAGVANRLERLRDRLANTRIRHADFQALIREFDGPETLFYLDPPYEGTDGGFTKKLAFSDFLSGLKQVKRGRFLASYSKEQARGFREAGYKVSMVESRQNKQIGGSEFRTELLISGPKANSLSEQTHMAEQSPVKIPEAEVNLRPKDFPTMKCAACRYFIAGVEPSAACKIVTRAEPKLVCDAYQGATRRATYKVADKDWLAFVNGMVKEQPYQHVVLRGFLTPEGPIVIIRDTMKPKPHVFSLSKPFHLEHTGQGEHVWQQDEVDRIIGAGAQGEAVPFSESFRIDLTYKPDEEPTHEQLEARRAEILKKFEDFVKAEFPKGEIKVELENLIPREMGDEQKVEALAEQARLRPDRFFTLKKPVVDFRKPEYREG